MGWLSYFISLKHGWRGDVLHLVLKYNYMTRKKLESKYTTNMLITLHSLC